jgi:hypothetical protein
LLVAVGLVCGCRFDFSGLPITSPPDLTSSSDLAASADGAASCAFALCDDFESGGLLPRWSTLQIHGSVMVDQTRAHSGLYALHAHADAVAPNQSISAHIAESATFPQLKNGLFARVELVDIHRTGLDVLGFDHFNLGYDFFKTGNQPAYDFFIDDWALDAARIGCN